MLEKTDFARVDLHEEDAPSLDPWYYYGILKKRILYALVPFVLVALGGVALALLWPATYLSEGKILAETQQIPVDLVRPTVTASAKERIQVIQQRVMTRENLLAVADKYQMFADRRDRLSRTDLLDLMRQNTRVEPVEDQTRGRNETIALTVGYMDRQPDIATKVANELLTLFLNEDARNRTNRAMETTKFLAREAQRLEGELTSIDSKLSELRKQRRRSGQQVGGQVSPVAALKAELASKAAVYSKSHPELKRLEAQIAALEKIDPPASPATVPIDQSDTDTLDALETQRKAAQANLEAANQKLAAARLGETLERDQFSERLQVLEQAVVPQKPIKPNRPKMLGLAFIAAMMAGVAGVFLVEAFDKTVRRSQDLLRLTDSHLIVSIPYISTRAELIRQKSKMAYGIAISIGSLLAGLAIVHLLIRPLDELWTTLLTRLFQGLPS